MNTAAATYAASSVREFEMGTVWLDIIGYGWLLAGFALSTQESTPAKFPLAVCLKAKYCKMLPGETCREAREGLREFAE